MAGFGVFGKLPSLGDFLRAGLPAGFASAWDEWLQDAMITARGRLGDSWNDTYLSAPIWRFSLPVGQAGPAAVSGIMMASVDRVGRQFPLTFVTAHAGDPVRAHFANRATFERLETLALDALDHDTPRDDLLSALDGVPMEPAGGGTLRMRHYAGDLPVEAVLAAQALDVTGQAIWTCANGPDHRMMLCKTLPGPEDFAALLNLEAAVWQAAPARVPA